MTYSLRRCQTDPNNIHSIDAYFVSVITGLDRLCFPTDEPYPTEGRWWWVVEDEDRNPVAFAGLAPLPETPGWLFLCRSGVLPQHRRKGLAQKLTRARLRFASTRCHAVISYVDRDNVASGNNLIKAGLRLTVPAYKYGGDDAIYFTKEFSS